MRRRSGGGAICLSWLRLVTSASPRSAQLDGGGLRYRVREVYVGAKDVLTDVRPAHAMGYPSYARGVMGQRAGYTSDQRRSAPR